MTTDYNNPPEYKISWEECDKIVAYNLKFYKRLVDDSGVTHPVDIAYNARLKECIDFILCYLGEYDDN